MTDDEKATIIALYRQGESVNSLGKKFHHKAHIVRRFLVGAGLEIRNKQQANAIYALIHNSLESSEQNNPSPEEIRRATEEIQASWTKQVRQQRIAVPENPVTIPTCPTGPLDGRILRKTIGR